MVCWTPVSQHKEVSAKVTALASRTLASETSKISSPNTPLERQPMLDISNKLHALVDEFVSNLSSECNSLANNVSSQAHIFFGQESAPDAAKAPRPSNRTSTEVLNGLKRPSGDHVMDSLTRGGKSHMEHAIANKKDINHMDGGRSSQQDELLSSDHSSDNSHGPLAKLTKKVVGNRRATKVRNSRPRVRSPRADIESPKRSPESSHMMNYSYEGDTKSLDGRSADVETAFQKLQWPQDIEDLLEDRGAETENQGNGAERNKQSEQKNGRPKGVDDTLLEDDDESTEDGSGRNLHGTGSDIEELPVLPKVPVKRRLLNEPGAVARRTLWEHANTKVSGLTDFWCIIRIIPGDLSIVQGSCEV